MSPGRRWACLALLAWSSAAQAAPAQLWAPGDSSDSIVITYKNAASSSDLKLEAQRLGLPAGSPEGALREALRIQAHAQVDLEVPLIHMQRLRVSGAPGEAAVNAGIRSYLSSYLVRAAEPDHPLKAASVALNDPLYTDANATQWYLTMTAWPQAVAAYNAGSFSLNANVIVAVVDSGVASSHTDLAGQVLAGASFVPSPGTGDDLGHGSMVAGLIGALTGNATGMAGAFIDSSKLKILPVKVINGCGASFNSYLAAGIVYAVQQGAKVLNVSVETDDSTALESAVDEARTHGVFLVAASGNETGGGPTRYPAAYTQAFAVGSVDHLGARATYSDYGKLELSAPGGDVGVLGLTCTAAPNACCPFDVWSLADVHSACASLTITACGTPNSFDVFAGTSFSAPLVAAAAAMLYSQDPSRSVEDVQRILLQTASPSALGAGYHSQTGWGILNFAGALAYQSTPQSGPAMKAYNWPNPFNPERDRLTTLTFFLPEGKPAKLRLLDAGGDLVKQWNVDDAQGGMNLVVWDGRNGAGNPVAVGAYTLVVDSGGWRTLAQVAVLH